MMKQGQFGVSGVVSRLPQDGGGSTTPLGKPQDPRPFHGDAFSATEGGSIS